jgi:hypothetical protein
MNRKSRSFLGLSSLGLAAFAATVFASPSARADEPSAASAPAPVAQPQQEDRPVNAEPVKELKSLAIEANPLAAAIGRYSLQVEWLPAAHHALVVNPHYDSVNSDTSITVNGQTTTLTQSFSGFGGEVGYRFYTGKTGPLGFFIGPSLLVAKYTSSAGDASTSFTSLGGAVDLGGQAVIGPGIVVGGGFGLQYTKISQDVSTDGMSLAAAVIAGGGVRPRALFTVGYAF